jgi:uncharacterized protein YpuA (DUF1002 family)
MADTPKTDGTPFDPMAPWREMRDAYLDVWSKTMVETVNSEAYAKATGGMLDAYLSVSAPFRGAVEKAMLQALQQLSMPTRADIIALAERMTNVEMRLDDMDAKLDRIQAQISKPATAGRRAAAPQTRRRKRTK